MVAITFLTTVSSLFLASWASPVHVSGSVQTEALKFPPIDPRGLLCKIPIIQKLLCPRSGSSTSDGITTPIGVAQGTLDISGANRFAVKYASASRWGESTVATTWALPNGATNVTALPLACPQPNVDDSAFSEDCLSMILYVPTSLTSMSTVPTLMWIHGGSFIVGSATGPGLDGSALAIATNSIVAVVQYRLGALGFMAPDGSTNLAVKDLVNALHFLKTNIASFGGSSSKITIAGQSSGASLVRALLATPSASSLFQSAILQSDTVDYGFLTPATQVALQGNFNSLINCQPSDTACLSSLSLDDIISAQSNLFSNAVNIDASTGTASPIRPVRDGSLITTPLDSSAPFPAVSKPILLSTVLNEAGPAIYGSFPDAVPSFELQAIMEATFGVNRTDTILSSDMYPVSATDGTDGDDARPQLQAMGTDYIWRCSGWTLARNWVENGGTAFVGLYTVGATYPGNDDVPFCTQSGSVCHQDDIEIVFGTVTKPTSAQSKLTTQMQARYKAFLTTGNPNVNGVPTWTAATSTNVHPLLLGGTGEAAVGACSPAFWGEAVQFDYQVFNI